MTVTGDAALQPPPIPEATGPRLATAPIGPWNLAAGVGIGLVVAGLVEVHRHGGPITAGWVLAPILVMAWLTGGNALLRRACPLGRLAVGGATAAALAYVGAAARLGSAHGLPGRLLLAVGLFALPGLALHLLVGLPDGRLDSSGRRTLVGVGYGVAALGAGWWLATDHRGIGGPVTALAIAAGVAGAFPANRRYVETVGLARQRLQWIGCAVAVAAEVAVVAVALDVLTGWPHHLALVVAAGSLTVPLALVASSTPLVSRVDRMLVTTVSVTGLSGVVLAVYIVVVIGLGRTPTHDERHLLVLSMAAAALAALLYVPARRRLGEGANRLVYGERHAPDESIRTFGSRLSRAIPMDELLLQLAESLKKTMALTSAEIWTGDDGRYDRAVSVPDRRGGELHIGAEALPVVTRAGATGTAWVQVWLPELLATRPGLQVRVVPISHSGSLLGLFVLDRPADRDPFDDEDDVALTELARQVGLALHNVQLDSALQASLDEVRRYAGELQASRARIVATGDAERRKIERNLHDGAQQHLVALAVNLRLVADIVGDDPGSAKDMLAMLADSVKDTIQELRDLAHGIYPPLLMDSGLGEALRAAGGRSPLDVTVDVVEGRYPTEVEAAVYFCCLEALQNAGKHAPDATVSIRVWQDDDEHRLHFAVADDGPGFDVATATAGHGHVNMSDRLGAIGGETEWRSAPDEGSTISGWVPVDA